MQIHQWPHPAPLIFGTNFPHNYNIYSPVACNYLYFSSANKYNIIIYIHTWGAIYCSTCMYMYIIYYLCHNDVTVKSTVHGGRVSLHPDLKHTTQHKQVIMLFAMVMPNSALCHVYIPTRQSSLR